MVTGGSLHQVVNPADGSAVAELALATPADVDVAVASARAALRGWSRATPAERSSVLARLAELVEAHAQEIVAEEVSQTGKPVRLAREFDVPGSIDNIAFFAGAARHLEGKAAGEYSGDHTSSIRREAVGVVATITPWNYPLQMAVWKVLPALAAGCSVVIKPAELTPLTTLTLARLATEAGLPDGVLNVVTGAGADVGTALAGHRDVDVVTFTGSTAVGRRVMAAAAVHGHRTQLELGGKAPFVVFDAAALDAAIPTGLRVGRTMVESAEAGDAAFAAALDHGQEGVVIKAVHAAYDVGRRGSAWIKVKPRHTLDLVILAAEWGHGRRRGWLSNLHLGARDPDGGFVMLGKTFKGLTDAMLAWQTERLLGLAVERGDWVVTVRPELVVEIAFDGVQASTRYPGGVALRFARVLRYREDKSASEADTIGAVRALSHAFHRASE